MKDRSPRNSPRPPAPLRLAALALGLALTSFGAARGDRGGWQLRPVVLQESGQRAILGWDGRLEVLCLATDVSASERTLVIEFLPLPAEPKVSLGSRASFEAAPRVLARRRVGFPRPLVRGKHERPMDAPEPAFQITFHERLGAHDLTVVRVQQAPEFVQWLQAKAAALGHREAALPPGIPELITKYLKEYQCPYLVFDVIEVGEDPRSVEPLVYEFESRVLFYPLEISRTFQGETTIDLVAFTEDRIDADPLLAQGFAASTIGRVTGEDLQEILPRLRELLGESAVAQAFRYTGDVRALAGNVQVGLRREALVYTQAEQNRASARAFYRGLGTGLPAGLILAWACLWPCYGAARRQRPRWAWRLAAGFLVGLPLGSVGGLGAAALLEEAFRWRFNYDDLPELFLLSAGAGFIACCFQLGLGRKWYLWGLVYAAAALPAAFVVDPGGLEDLFILSRWDSLWDRLGPPLTALLIVFPALFLSARLLVWISGTVERAWRGAPEAAGAPESAGPPAARPRPPGPSGPEPRRDDPADPGPLPREGN